MKAIQVDRWGGPEVMKVREVAQPEPGPGQVRIDVYAAGLNPNETYVLTGQYAFYKPALPFMPGFDAAGIVDAVGDGVSHLQKGDRVYAGGMMAKHNTGSYAESLVMDADLVHPLPDSVSFVEGAALGIPADAAYRALFLVGALKAGETVLIHGAAGGVGQLAVQMALAAGAHVIGTASSEEGRAMLRELGAAHALPHLQADSLDALRDATEGRGPDLIVEFLANVNLPTDMDAIAPGGRIVVVGNRGPVEIDARRLMEKESSIRGMAVTHVTPEDRAETDRAIAKMLRDGTLKPQIGKIYAMEEIAQAHKDLLDRKARGKLILGVREESRSQ